MKQVNIFCNVPYIWILFLVILSAFQLLISGCNFVGPTSISQGRLSYAEAINQTEDKQMLLTIVKSRYRETSTHLAVSSVSANLRFRTSADMNLGFGNEQDYTGNLIPFGAGIAYEENPTILYQPVKGDRYFQQLMSPIPLDIFLISLRSETYGSNLITIVVNRINSLRNPVFLKTSMHEKNQKFKRFIEVYSELNNAGLIELVKNPQGQESFDLLINDYTADHSDTVTEFCQLLNLSIETEKFSNVIIIPVSLSVTAEESKIIGIITRSIYDLFEIMGASIVVPQEHAEAGLTRIYSQMGLAGQDIKILSSKTKPDNMSLAVRYREYWFYIDETDQSTKSFFALTRALWSYTSTSSDIQSGAPVLTIPVSR